MQYRTVYILLLLLVFYNTALNQFLKLPVLISHYLEHKERDCRLSITGFLCMHYWGQDVDDQDDERDKQLPYKDVDVHTIQHHFVPLEKPLALRPAASQEPSIDYPVIKDLHLPAPALSSLFRPPRA